MRAQVELFGPVQTFLDFSGSPCLCTCAHACGALTCLLWMPCKEMGLGAADMDELATLAPRLRHVTTLVLNGPFAMHACAVLRDSHASRAWSARSGSSLGTAGAAACCSVLDQMPQLQDLDLGGTRVPRWGGRMCPDWRGARRAGVLRLQARVGLTGRLVAFACLRWRRWGACARRQLDWRPRRGGALRRARSTVATADTEAWLYVCAAL